MKVYQVKGDTRYDYYNKYKFFDTILFYKEEDAMLRLKELKKTWKDNDFPLVVIGLEVK